MLGKFIDYLGFRRKNGRNQELSAPMCELAKSGMICAAELSGSARRPSAPLKLKTTKTA
jgi:hypothetical protein